MDDALRAWLLEGDPAVRWRVTRDPRERERIAAEGWGAGLLAAQDESGTWAGGVYSPKWTSTTYTCSTCSGWDSSRGTRPPSAGATGCGSGRRGGGCPRRASRACW